MSRVWFIMTEVRARPDTDFPGPVGIPIYVECFVPETEIQIAIDRAAEALDSRGYELADVSRAGRLDLNAWDWEEYPADGVTRAIAERVVDHGEVEIGPFFYGGTEHDHD